PKLPWTKLGHRPMPDVSSLPAPVTTPSVVQSTQSPTSDLSTAAPLPPRGSTVKRARATPGAPSTSEKKKAAPSPVGPAQPKSEATSRPRKGILDDRE